MIEIELWWSWNRLLNFRYANENKVGFQKFKTSKKIKSKVFIVFLSMANKHENSKIDF